MMELKLMPSTTDISAAIHHDRFAAIKYQTRKDKKSAAIGLQLGPHFVFKWLVQESWNHFAASIPTASTCKFYSAENLFNDAERWEALEKPFHIAIGRCLAYFVDKKMLPLSCGNPYASNKLYLVTSTNHQLTTTEKT
jgi:hypothetical protein